MPDNFHLPYHFIPWSDDGARKHDLLRSNFPAQAPAHVTHDRYVPGTHTGRLVCRLTTQTPIVVGGIQSGDAPKRVQNYTLGGKPAVPASSLRGLVSNLAEAASNSAFRVLDAARTYSFRRSMERGDKKLSAMGSIHEDPNKPGTFYLRPLTIPVLEANRDGLAPLPAQFTKYFPKPVLKVYLGNSASIRNPHPIHQNTPRGQYVAMQLSYRDWSPGFRLDDDDYQYRKPAGSRRFVLSQLPVDPNQSMNRLPIYDPATHPQNKYWVPGVIRALGAWPQNRREAMPNTKKHEYFLPVPTDRTWPIYRIPDEVVKDFNALADERTEASRERHFRDSNNNPLLPFEPFGTRPERYEQDHEQKSKLRLKTGDIVYFDVNPAGEICEISFSSVWRGKIEGAVKTFFPAPLWPFDHDKPNLTPADLLFGFVEDWQGLDEKAKEHRVSQGQLAKALASRLQFSAAQVDENLQVQTLPRTLRKILDAPKPPSPALYFRKKKEPLAAIRKFELNSKDHQAQGRKQYLHHPWAPGQTPWKSSNRDRLDQKAELEPIAAGQSFYFHIDFQNLSPDELGLLLYVLHPGPEFRHKIGLGKPIGLGTIHIQPLACFSMEPVQRYSRAGLHTPRYASVLAGADLQPESWPERYSVERSALPAGGSPDGLSPLRDTCKASIPANIRQAIELLGDPAKLTAPVHTPLVEEASAASEDKTFEWFVANDKENSPQFLKPISGGTTALPTLRKLPRP